ncbi:MAG: LysM peptidoglycan-binding domain-containing protein [Candidatus Riflebacteria bacterium]|nr:LysM peptidoglycan-binding domain-containing protein [Candidatus Riflebacteria bacterium]
MKKFFSRISWYFILTCLTVSYSAFATPFDENLSTTLTFTPLSSNIVSNENLTGAGSFTVVASGVVSNPFTGIGIQGIPSFKLDSFGVIASSSVSSGTNIASNTASGTAKTKYLEITVKSGDSLCSLAKKYLGSEAKYTELIQLNKDKYPSLVKNPNLILKGWVLKIKPIVSSSTNASSNLSLPNNLTASGSATSISSTTNTISTSSRPISYTNQVSSFTQIQCPTTTSSNWSSTSPWISTDNWTTSTSPIISSAPWVIPSSQTSTTLITSTGTMGPPSSQTSTGLITSAGTMVAPSSPNSTSLTTSTAPSFSPPAVNIITKDSNLGTEMFQQTIQEKNAAFCKKVSQLIYFPDDKVPELKSITYDVHPGKFASQKSGAPPNITIEFSSDYLLDVANNRTKNQLQDEIEGILSHEITHGYQLSPGEYRSGTETFGFVEGLADYARLSTTGFNPPRTPCQGGNWKDGYCTTGFFYLWLVQTKDPDFARKLNASCRTIQPWNHDAATRQILGVGIEDLWNEYQKAIPKYPWKA